MASNNHPSSMENENEDHHPACDTGIMEETGTSETDLIAPIFKCDRDDVFPISWTISNRQALSPIFSTVDESTFFFSDNFLSNLPPTASLSTILTLIHNVGSVHETKKVGDDKVDKVWFSLPFSIVRNCTFDVTNLPAETTLATLLDSIRNVGRIYTSKMDNNVGMVTFSDGASARRFWQRHRDGLRVGTSLASVSRHTDTASAEKLSVDQMFSRVLLVTGCYAVVNRHNITGMLRMSTRGRFDTEYVKEKTMADGQATVEWVFGSCKQASLALAVVAVHLKKIVDELAEEYPDRTLGPISISFGRDPSM